MKFCKALHKVMEASDPSYRPYWTNYKRLKKLIKAIDAYGVDTKAVASADGHGISTAAKTHNVSHSSNDDSFFFPKTNSTPETAANDQQQQSCCFHEASEHKDLKAVKARLKHNPGEVAFFQLLYSELGKASDFFGKAEKQFGIREEIVRVSMQVLKRPVSVTVKDRWSVLSKAVFRLYKDLLLLETYAIMTYFAFSKILKKHDKVTGIETREPFMINVVNKANFTNYPRIMDMIQNCQTLYQDASQRLLQNMYEDERLFLYMVEQIQRQPGVPLQSLLREIHNPNNNDDDDAQHSTAGAVAKTTSGQGHVANNNDDANDDKKPPARSSRKEPRSGTAISRYGSLPTTERQAPRYPPQDYHRRQWDREDSSSDDDDDGKSARPTKKSRVRFHGDPKFGNR
ncbi:hypothetical protein ACA910_018163 [Epithemia clementina (nom. ined.)]